jgi:type I restriction enzyme S subunit
MSQLAQGSTRYNLAKSTFLQARISLPPQMEQNAIAEILSDIDSLIEALDRRAIKEGAMQQLLTGKKRLKGFTEPWIEKKLGKILNYEQPTNYIVKSTDYVETGIPVLTAGKIFILGYTYESEGVYAKSPVIIFDDFTTASKYVDFKFKVKSSAMKILQARNDKYNLRFIFELMQMIDFQLSDHQRYWISEYSELFLLLPDNKKEQNAIAQILTDMDNEIGQLENERQKYVSLKQGAMQQLLTGQIRLANAAVQS